MRLVPNNFGSSKLTTYGNIEATGTVAGASLVGNGSQITNINANAISTGRVPTPSLSGTYNIDINGNARTATTASVALSLSSTAGTFEVADARFSGKVTLSPLITGGLHWPNDPFGAAGDTASITLLNPAGQDMRMTFKLTNNAGDQFEFIAPDNNGIKYNSHIMLHANNYNNYAPSKAGAGATGNWPINITGNSRTVTTLSNEQVIEALGFTPVNPTALTNIAGSAVVGTTGTFSGKVTVAQGSTNGIHWPTNSYGGSGDTARITLETASGEATRMRFTMTNDADDYFEFSAPNTNGLKMNSHTVLHADNYNDYAPTKGGVGASGTWPIGITGNARTVTTLTNTQIISALGFTPVSPDAIASNGTFATTSYVNNLYATAGTIKAWVVFDGSVGQIISSLRVNSVTNLGSGYYRITIASGTFGNGNFAAAGMASDTDHFVAYAESSATELYVRTIDNAGSNESSQTTSGRVTVMMAG
jgi:hypothetical protein